MSSVLTARIAYGIAIGLLAVCALIVYSTLRGFVESERLVEHTQQVQVLLGETESAIAAAARARLTYVFSGQDDALAQYQRDVAVVPVKLEELHKSIKDEPAQQAPYNRLNQLVNDRIQLWEKSVAMRRDGTPQAAGQPDLTRQSVAFADDIVSVSQQMRGEEARVLAGRKVAAGLHFVLTIAFLVTTFLAAVWLLLWHHRLLREELQARQVAEQQTQEAANAARQAEQKARESENAAIASNRAARRLSARLLSLQDEERRRLSRELHDSTGQDLAAAKMLLAPLAAVHPDDKRYAECMDLLDRSLREIRTISHLLHPSGLEEAGFSVAARWYGEEFAKRSGVQVNLDIPDLDDRLPREVEIALFRVLQESLANIHRHSKSRSAEIQLRAGEGQLTLTVTDHGIGIPKEQLEQFWSAGTAGVGLAGMRERMRELGGTFAIDSNGHGTSLKVSVPVSQELASAAGE